MRSLARSLIFTIFPMSRTKISPWSPIDPAWMMRETASAIDMKYRSTSGWVTVTGPPRAICFWNSGTTLPRLPRTFPNRTQENFVALRAAMSWMMISPIFLVAPMTLVGLTALSEEMKMKLSTPCRSASLGHVHRPLDVVEDGLADVEFHERDVFVGRRVEDDLGPERWRRSSPIAPRS